MYYLLTETRMNKGRAEPIDVGELARYDRPMSSVANYDTLLTASYQGHA